MGCGTKLVQFLFFAFIFIFWILGLVVLAIGVYSHIENDTWRDLIDSKSIFEAANLLIAAGVIVAFIGFLGCCGAIKKIQWMLIGYAILVILIFILQLAAGMYAYVKGPTIEISLGKKLRTGIKTNYGQSGTTSQGLTKAIDWFQKKVKCCGAISSSDWKESTWHRSNNKTSVPESCCKVQSTGCNIGASNSIAIFPKGCVEEGKIFAKKNIKLLGIVGIVIAIIELLGIIFSICLCKTYRDEEKTTSAKVPDS